VDHRSGPSRRWRLSCAVKDTRARAMVGCAGGSEYGCATDGTKTVVWDRFTYCHAKRLTRQTALAKEASFRQDGHHRFFALLGHNRELHLAALDVENRIRRVPLRKD
jgi:hypothetical protein